MRQKYDIIVAGGGMSGVSAAVSAAKCGRSVLLVEQSAMLGGMGTNGLITMVMTSRHWFYGFGKELLNALIAKGDARFEENPAVKGYNYYPFDGEGMKRALDDAVLESGADLLLLTKVIGIEKKGDCITRIQLAGCEGNFWVEADVYIDATGDAMLALYAGEAVAVGDEQGEVQAPTMLAYYAGVDFERYEAFLKQYEDGVSVPKINMIHDLLPKAVKEGVITRADQHHPGIFRIRENADVGLMNAGHVYGARCADAEGLTAATVQGRKMAAEYFAFYRRYIPGFENAYMTHTGNVLGLRESRRVIGKYVTNFEDKANYVKFEDSIMRYDGGAVSDLHASSGDAEAYEAYLALFNNRKGLRENDWATLPYRSLLPQNTKNLIIAGRCISADRKVLGQIRIMGYCFMMGEAAGLAAALSIASGKHPDQIEVGQLQHELHKKGIET